MRIKITKKVTFRNRYGDVLAEHEVGAVIEASAKGTHYYVTPMGGIYFDEAREIENEQARS